MPEDRSRNCNCRASACWSPPPTRPPPASSSPKPTRPPRRPACAASCSSSLSRRRGSRARSPRRVVRSPRLDYCTAKSYFWAAVDEPARVSLRARLAFPTGARRPDCSQWPWPVSAPVCFVSPPPTRCLRRTRPAPRHPARGAGRSAVLQIYSLVKPMDEPQPVAFEFDRVIVRRAGRRVLDEVTTGIPATGITVISGPSGAGKTTLLRLCNRLEVPDEGTVRYRRRPLDELD